MEQGLPGCLLEQIGLELSFKGGETEGKALQGTQPEGAEGSLPGGQARPCLGAQGQPKDK